MVHVVMRVSGCLLCLVLLFFVEIPLSALGASQQACLPTVPDQLTTPPEQVGTVLINEALLSSKKKPGVVQAQRQFQGLLILPGWSFIILWPSHSISIAFMQLSMEVLAQPPCISHLAQQLRLIAS